MGAAEVGGGRILVDVDDAAADRASATELIEQGLAATAPNRARERCGILVEAAEHLSEVSPPSHTAVVAARAAARVAGAGLCS